MCKLVSIRLKIFALENPDTETDKYTSKWKSNEIRINSQNTTSEIYVAFPDNGDCTTWNTDFTGA